MKKIVTTAFFMVVSLALLGQGQEKPLWLNESGREKHYPSYLYISGFAQGNLSQNKSLEDVEQLIKEQAKNKLLENFCTQISSIKKIEIVASNSDGQYKESETFSVESITKSMAKIAGMKTELYYNPKSNSVYAFAYVLRNDLINYYDAHIKDIVNDMGKIVDLKPITSSVEHKNRIQKYHNEASIYDSLSEDIKEYKGYLKCIGNNEDKLYEINKILDLLENNKDYLSKLKISVYVNCKVENYSNEFCTVISNRVTAQLEKNGCVIENEAASKADFCLNVALVDFEAKPRDPFLFYYAALQYELIDVRTGKRINGDNQVTGKGGSSSSDYQGAMKTAIDDAALRITTKIASHIIINQ